MMWLSSSGSFRGQVEPGPAAGAGKKATDVQTKSRSATFTTGHLPAIDANMSTSGAWCSASSAESAFGNAKPQMNVTAIARHEMRMNQPPGGDQPKRLRRKVNGHGVFTRRL